METTLIKVIGKTAITIAKCAGLLILSSVAAGELRKNTNVATQEIIQSIRFVKSGMDMKKMA